MRNYLISFPEALMTLPESELRVLAAALHAVAQEAKAAGVWVSGSGMFEGVLPVRVTDDDQVETGAYPEARIHAGGYVRLKIQSALHGVAWCSRFSETCRVGLKIRVFTDDPNSGAGST